MALLKGVESADSAALSEQLDDVLNLRTWITRDTYGSMLSLRVEKNWRKTRSLFSSSNVIPSSGPLASPLDFWSTSIE